MKTYCRKKICLLPLLLTAALALSACGGGSDVRQPAELSELEHPTHQMEVLWKANGGAGAGKADSRFAPIVSDSLVYTANHDGEIVARRQSDGDRAWHKRLDRQLMAGPTKIGDTLLVSTRDGSVLALSADDGEEKWSTKLSSEVISRPSGNQHMVLARTVDGTVAAMKMDNGDRLWTIDSHVPNLTMRGTSTPTPDGELAYVGLDNGKFRALDMETGEQRWEQTVAIPEGRSELDRLVDINADPLIDAGHIYAVSVGNALVAMDRDSGEIQWKAEYSASNDMAMDEDNLYLTDLDDIVHAASRMDGSEVWKQDDLKYRRLSAPAVVGDHVLVGDYEGYLHWISTRDGSIEGRGHPFNESIQAQPVIVDDDTAIVLGTDGTVAAVRFTPDDD